MTSFSGTPSARPVRPRPVDRHAPARSVGLSGPGVIIILLAGLCAAFSAVLMTSGADASLSRSLIKWGGDNPGLLGGMNLLSNLSLLKGGIAASILWWLWFRNGDGSQLENRAGAVAVFLVAVVAIAVGRVTANFLPFRPRPLGDPDVAGPRLNAGEFFQDWSSFPSDHALLYGAIAVATIHLASRLGWWMLGLHAVMMVSLPRVIVAKHYLSDVLSGLAIGMLIGWFLLPPLMRLALRLWTHVPTAWRRADLAYPAMFLMTFELATNFDGTRRLLVLVKGVLT